jgi:6-phosphogluconolactonase
MAPLHCFDSREELVDQLGTAIIDDLQSAINATGKATMAVSGGNSPKLLFRYLSRQSIDWSAVTITLVDERWVAENNPNSNAKLVKDHLLQHCAGAAKFVGLYDGSSTPFEAEPQVNQTLSSLVLPFDVVILGMGDDGHTASFFPKTPTLPQALALENQSLCCAVKPPNAPYLRMTLTLPTLLNSRHLYLLVTGESKFSVLHRAMETFSSKSDQDEWVQTLPVRSVIHQHRSPINIYYAD